jgi:signal peptidase II
MRERDRSQLVGPESEVVPAVGQPDAQPAAQRALRLVWWLIAVVVVFDQVTKWLVLEHVPLFSSIQVVPGFIDLVHVRNAGVAFGFLNETTHPLRSFATTGLAVVALIGIIYYATHLRAEERLARMGLSLILGGAVGNLVDRAVQGFVVDFVDVYWHDWHFWAFNVADAAISIGAVLMFLELFFPSRHASHPV